MKEKKISIECSLSFLQCIGKDVLIYLHILWDRAVSKKIKIIKKKREEKVLARPPNNLISGTIADSIPLCSIIAPTIFFSFFYLDHHLLLGSELYVFFYYHSKLSQK